MAMKRCDNGHYFDQAKHTTCPHCGVKGLDINFTASKGVGEDNHTVPMHENKNSASAGGETVGIVRKKLGIDPVVGWLVCIEGPDRGRDYRIRSERNFIGRSEKMGIYIAGDQTISRENHAIVSYNPKGNSFKLQVGESRGLVYLNGDEVDISVQLTPYDCIELGQTKLLFVPFCGERFKWS